MLFEQLFNDNSIIRKAIQEKIDEEVNKAKSERDLEVAELKKTIESLTATLLMGGK